MSEAKRQSWTSEEDEVIRKGKAEGLRYEEIAERLEGRTKAAVSLRAFTIGVAKQRGTPAAAAAPASAAAEEPKRRGRPSKAFVQSTLQTEAKAGAAEPKRRGRPPKAEAAAAAPAAKRRGRPPAAAKAAEAPSAPVAVAAPAPTRKPRTPRANAVVASAPANGNGNGHHAHSSSSSTVLSLGGFQLEVNGAQLELTPGGVQFAFGDGRRVRVLSAQTA